MSIKIIVLASGRGSNFEAIYNSCKKGEIDGEIIGVFSDKLDAEVLKKAEKNRIYNEAIVSKTFKNKVDYEKALLDTINSFDYDLICLAGYMKVLGKTFLEGAKSKIMNIHPSLLPAFQGLKAQKQAVDYGVKYSGCTVHFVDEGLDTGPIIAQEVVEVYDDDTEESLSKRIIKKEHKLYSEVISDYQKGYIDLVGNKVKILREK